MRRGETGGQTKPKVSIHASVKDATIGSAYIRARKDVSIHASVKDATFKINRLVADMIVSIHASVKDATQDTRAY